ncbi:single-stranded-DNA-specific exonuclease RecJ [Methanobrevibacter filiformis]|uniref:single-stranded-DNA-specific exonuclease RecJ n=1 Tax=Methanobrevibacter filiformis TaxID=55758 RepID=UPI000AE10E98|nr:DHH family phosphoesterase [Methanobrevibacter filiformis]
MLNRANEAGRVLKKHIKNGDNIRIISHNDADGISAAAIIANTIKEEGGNFHVTMIPRLKKETIEKLHNEKYNLFIFTDMGSACINHINKLKADVIIADHHQPNDTEASENVVHVNPHLFEVDGSRELSGSGASYLVVRELDKNHLSIFALIGAFGDMQHLNGFTGVNELILNDAVESGKLEIHEDLKITSKNQEPLYKAIAYTLDPGLPDLTGSFEGSMAFLEKLGISYGIKFADLSGEEQDVLKDALIDVNPKIFGQVFSTPKDSPALRDLEDFSSILDSCGKSKKYGLGLSLCLGERDKALETAIEIQNKYRNNLVKGFEWIRKEGAVELDHIQYIYSEDPVLKTIIGTLAGVGLFINILNSEKPVIGISRFHKDIKISGRTTRELVNKGVDLGKALHDASVNFHGQGGGHNIAAGAMIPHKNKDEFLHLVNDIVASQLEK